MLGIALGQLVAGPLSDSPSPPPRRCDAAIRPAHQAAEQRAPLLTFNGIGFPNGAASAMAGQQGSLGSASALLGLGQFGLGGLLAPLVGVGGQHDALPMGLVIGICGLGALAVNLTLSPRLAGAQAPA